MSTVPNQVPRKYVTPQPGKIPRSGIAVKTSPPYRYHQPPNKKLWSSPK